MRSLLMRFVIAILLVSAAVLARREAGRLRTDAVVLERLATLRIDIPAEAVARQRALADYWRGAYGTLTNNPEALTRQSDPGTLLLAANAAFRAAERPPAGQTRPARIQQLDSVIQAYANALKAPLFLPDAAYNYEYVVRLRDAAARARGAAAPASKAAPVTPSADLPAGPTIHGRPGGPPPDTKGEEFEIITPMEYGDREAQPLPTTGAKPLRKG